MLTRISKEGNKYIVSSKPDPNIKKLLALEQVAIENYIKSQISEVEIFSLATHFGNPWPSVLDPIYRVTGDELLAAFLLTNMIQEELIHDIEQEWLCTQTNITKRNFESNAYWRAK